MQQIYLEILLSPATPRQEAPIGYVFPFVYVNGRSGTLLQNSQRHQKSYMILRCLETRSRASKPKSVKNSCHTLGNTRLGLPGLPGTLFFVSSTTSVLFSRPVTWVGINDGGHRLDPYGQLMVLFDLEEALYQVGARHFVFFTVPPFERVPQSSPFSNLGANFSHRCRPRIEETPN